MDITKNLPLFQNTVQGFFWLKTSALKIVIEFQYDSK